MKKEELEIKKAKFTSNQIIIKKRRMDIIIPLDKIEKIFYAEETFRNYISLGFGDVRCPGFAYIYLNEKIGSRKMYCLYITYENILKLPKNIFKKIEFFNTRL